jgi:hypothetical protein
MIVLHLAAVLGIALSLSALMAMAFLGQQPTRNSGLGRYHFDALALFSCKISRLISIPMRTQ